MRDVDSLPELEEEEQTLGTPTFEVLVRDGRPLVSGSYYMAPPLYMREAEWDGGEPGKRLLVKASDGSRWYAENVALQGPVNVLLKPLDGSTAAYKLG